MQLWQKMALVKSEAEWQPHAQPPIRVVFVVCRVEVRMGQGGGGERHFT